MNVVKIAPETALRLTLNDRIKAVVAKNHLERITPWERMACGGLAGASAQVFLVSFACPTTLFSSQCTLRPCNRCCACIKFGLLSPSCGSQDGWWSPLRADRTLLVFCLTAKTCICRLLKVTSSCYHVAVSKPRLPAYACRLSYTPWSW